MCQELAEAGRADELQPLAPALYQLCVQIPVEASLAVVGALQSAGVAWRRAAKARAKAAASAASAASDAAAASAAAHTPLPPGALALLATCAQIYPPSDFRHPMLTPMTLLMGEVRAATQALTLTSTPTPILTLTLTLAARAPPALPDDETTSQDFCSGELRR